MSTEGTFVACDPDNDDKGWDADDEESDGEESDGDTDKDSGGDEWNEIDSRCSFEHTEDDERNEEESIDSILAETEARIAKEWDEWVWGLDHVAAFKKPLWNTEGVWTGQWKSSDSGLSNDSVVPRASDGLNCVKGLGLIVEGLDHLQFLDHLVEQAGIEQWKSSDSGSSNDSVVPRASSGLNSVKGLGLNVEGLDHLQFLDHLVAAGTEQWNSSDSGPSNDSVVPRASDGLNCVKGLGLNLEGLEHLQSLDHLVEQAADGDGGTVDSHVAVWRNIGFDLACAFGTRTNISRYDPDCSSWVWLFSNSLQAHGPVTTG